MKQSVPAYYNAKWGVYTERRLRKSTQFLAGACVVAFGLAVVVLGQILHFGWAASIGFKVSPQTRLTAHNDSVPKAVAVAASTTSPTSPPAGGQEANLISSAVQTVISKPPAATWSVAIYDLQAKDWLYRNNSSDQMSAASLSQLYLVYGLSKKIPFTQWASTHTAGNDLQTCVDLMIRLSDSACNKAIDAFVGWQSAEKAVKAAGYKGTSLDPTFGAMTTAEDTTRFMAELYQGKLFDAATTDFLKNSLKNQAYRSAIPAGCQGCVTYNKAANATGVAHDSAVVVSGGRTYSITIMSRGGYYSKLATVERAIQGVITTSTP